MQLVPQCEERESKEKSESSSQFRHQQGKRSVLLTDIPYYIFQRGKRVSPYYNYPHYYQRGKRVDQLFPLYPSCHWYRWEGGDKVVWPENTLLFLMILRYPPITIGCEYLLKRSVLPLPLNNVLSVKARLETSGQGGDLLLDSHAVHVWEMIVKFPEIMFWAIAKNMKGDLCWSMLVQTGKDFRKWLIKIEKGKMLIFSSTAFFNDIQQP